MNSRLPVKRLLVIGTALVTIAGGAGVARAAGLMPAAPPAVVVGCAKDANGQLRIVGDPSECLPSEHAVSFAGPQGPRTVNVDCAAGQTIMAALQAAPVHLPLTLNVRGTCTESVRIHRDEVTLNAASAGDGIRAPSAGQPALSLNGARHISLFGFTLTGGDNALTTTGGAGVFALNLHVTQAGNGILLTNASSGQFFNLTVDHSRQSGAGASSGSALSIGVGSITDSGLNGIDIQNGHLEASSVTISRSGAMGVALRDGGSAELRGTTIQDSGDTGVHVFNGSVANLIGGTVVSGARFGGVIAHSGSVNLQGAHITRNHGAAVSTFAGGRLNVQGNSVIDANDGDGVMVAGGGVASLQGPNSITGNAQFGVHLRDVAMLQLGPGANQVAGNGSGPDIFCEASALARVSGPLGTASTNCQTS